MCNAIDWNAVAAWVQAVGSLIAIGVAILLGERQSRRAEQWAERERARQAEVVATGLASALYPLKLDTKLKAHVVSKLLEAVPATGNFIVSSPSAIMEQAGMREPPPLSNMLAWTTVLGGDAAKQAILVTQSLDLVRRTLERLLHKLSNPIPADTAKQELAGMLKRLEELEEQVDHAMSLLSPIHGMDPSVG